MKRHILFMAAMISFTAMYAQAPQLLSYQAVIRNAAGTLLNGQSLGMRISILQGSNSGTAVYVETQNPTSNSNGLVSLSVGSGTIVTGTMAGIDWSAGPYFIKTETDPTGGTSYTITGVSQLQSVPYALYAANAPIVSGTTNYVSKFTSATALGNSQIFDNGTQVGIGNAAPTSLLYVGSGTMAGSALAGINVALGVNSYVAASSGTVTSFIGAESTIGTLGTVTNHDLVFSTNNIEKMRLTAGGSFEVGTTSNYVSNPGYGGTTKMALKTQNDYCALYINQAHTSTNYGTMRVEYNGLSDTNRVGILSTTIRSVADINGTGVEGAGCAIGVQGLGESSNTTTSGNTVEGIEGDSYYSGTYSVGVAGFGSNYIAAPTNCYGVYGTASSGTTNYGVYSQGAMRVQGALSKLSGTFEIDHPLDPANKYLYHSFVESPDMMNIYNGNVTTDAYGVAVVELPNYFDTLNKDFRYQLTIMGTTFAQALVSKKVTNNKFEIKTSVPNVEVSWQVTGIRKDAWANAHRVVVEVDKNDFDKGKYLAPVEAGMPESLRIGDVKKRPRTGAEIAIPVKK